MTFMTSSPKKRSLTSAQQELVRLMRLGYKLMWFGDNGPEIEGRPFWPQKSTVRALLRYGVLRWKPYLNDTHKACGFCGLELTEAYQSTKEFPDDAYPSSNQKDGV